MLAAGINYIFL